jgi:hypothetical protein
MKFGFYSFMHVPVTSALFDPSIHNVSALCSKSLLSASHVEVSRILTRRYLDTLCNITHACFCLNEEG